MSDLLAVMPAHTGAGAIIDWTVVEQAWGVRFPADYKAYLATYGKGSIENYLSVLLPEAADGEPGGSMAFITDDARATWEDAPHGPGADASADDLIAWGVDGTGDLLCWLTTEANADDWPVAVYNRGDDLWSVVDCGMSEFLRKIFLGEFDDHPLSGTPLWGNRNPRFLTEAEQRRLKESGQDPWPAAG